MANVENESANQNADAQEIVETPVVDQVDTPDTTEDTVPDVPQGEQTKYDKFVAGITTLGKYIKVPLDAIFRCTGFFILVYLIAWTLNAFYSNIHFDLTAIRDFYIMVVTRNLGEHGINSLFNSDRGQMPTGRGK